MNSPSSKVSSSGSRKRQRAISENRDSTEKKPATAKKAKSTEKKPATVTKVESMPASARKALAFVPEHPLVKHWVAVLRNAKTPSGDVFKNAMAELGRLLFYEASKFCLSNVIDDLASGQVINPDKPIAIVPMLRAGLALAEHAASGLIPRKTYHLVISEDGTVYLNALPRRFPEGSRVFLLDPILTTDVTVAAALELIKKCGVHPKNVKVISAFVARRALGRLREKFPGLAVFTGALDDSKRSILEIGDAGNRCFGT